MVEIVKPEFVVGSEKKFSDFISRLNEKDKIALISHTDLDGIASAKIVNEIINADFLKFVNYKDLDNKLIEELKKEKIKKVIFTDLFFKDTDFLRKIEKFSEILIIDHHTFEKDFNSDKITFLNSDGYCATYLSYYLFSKIQNLEKYDWLVACASVADYCFKRNSAWLSEIYEKYDDKLVIENSFIIKEGKIWDLQYNLSLSIIYFDDNLLEFYEKIDSNIEKTSELEIYYSKVLSEVKENLDKFEKEKIKIKEEYFWEFKPKYHIKSFLINEISLRYPKNTLIIGCIDDKYYLISARRQDGKVDMNKLLQKLVSDIDGASAGGHFKAGGGFVLLKDKEEFKKRVLEM